MQTFVLVLALGAAVSPADCARIETAFSAWKNTTWDMERRMEVVLDDQLKARLVDQVTSQRGQVTVRPIKREVFDPELDLDEEHGDPAMRFAFTCQRAETLSAERFRLTSRDGLEQLTVRLSASDGKFFVEEWTRQERIRMLWKKLHIALRATYTAG